MIDEKCSKIMNLTERQSDVQKAVVTSLSKFRVDNTFSDVTLVSDDQKQFNAHKVVLSACSEVFQTLLVANDSLPCFIHIDGVSSESLKNILQFMYHGSVQMNDKSLESFLAATRILKLKGVGEDSNKRSDDDDDIQIEIPSEEDNDKGKNKKVIDIGSDFSDLKQVHKKLDIYYTRETDKMYKCSVCEYRSLVKMHMKEHLEGHVIGFMLSCDKCDSVMRSSSYLRAHKNLKHKYNTESLKLICGICENVFKQVEAYDLHMKTHRNTDVDVQAQTNSYSYVNSIEDLNKKLEEYFTIEPGSKFKCNFCEEEKDNQESILEHVDVHIQDFVYHCKECDKEFHTRTSIKAHIFQHKQKCIPPITGFEEMSTKEKLFSLRKYHSRLNASNFECKVCGKKERSSEHILEHLGAHYIGAEYICKYCKKSFKTRPTFRSHSMCCQSKQIQIKFKKRTKQIQINFEKRILTKKYERENKGHKSEVDSEGKEKVTIIQKLDGLEFMNKKEWKTALSRFYHKEGNLHICDICKKFSNIGSESTAEHVEVHMEGLQYNCSLCDKILKSRCRLRQHKNRFCLLRDKQPVQQQKSQEEEGELKETEVIEEFPLIKEEDKANDAFEKEEEKDRFNESKVKCELKEEGGKEVYKEYEAIDEFHKAENNDRIKEKLHDEEEEKSEELKDKEVKKIADVAHKEVKDESDMEDGEIKYESDNESATEENEEFLVKESPDLIGKCISMEDMNRKLEEYYRKEEGKLKCKVCEKVSLNIGHIREHLDSHIVGLIYSCDECEYQSQSRNTLRNHMRKHKVTGDYKPAPGGGKVFVESFRIVKDKRMIIREETKNEPEIPKIEGLEQMDQEEWKAALKKFCKRDVNGYQCTACDKISSSSFHILGHIETHMVGLHYSCTFCGSIFKGRQGLKHHQRKACKGSGSFDQGLILQEKIIPKIKGLEQMEFKEWKAALQNYYQKDPPHFAHCNICLQKKTLGSILNHVESHVEDLEYKCSYCSNTYKTRNSLRMHVKRICPKRPKNVTSILKKNSTNIDNQISVITQTEEVLIAEEFVEPHNSKYYFD